MVLVRRIMTVKNFATDNSIGKFYTYFSSDKVQNGLNIQAITGCLLISRLMVLHYCLSLGCHETLPVTVECYSRYAQGSLIRPYRMSLITFSGRY